MCRTGQHGTEVQSQGQLEYKAQQMANCLIDHKSV